VLAGEAVDSSQPAYPVRRFHLRRVSRSRQAAGGACRPEGFDVTAGRIATESGPAASFQGLTGVGARAWRRRANALPGGRGAAAWCRVSATDVLLLIAAAGIYLVLGDLREAPMLLFFVRW
jgi:hypothetical protein